MSIFINTTTIFSAVEAEGLYSDWLTEFCLSIFNGMFGPIRAGRDMDQLPQRPPLFRDDDLAAYRAAAISDKEWFEANPTKLFRIRGSSSGVACAAGLNNMPSGWVAGLLSHRCDRLSARIFAVRAEDIPIINSLCDDDFYWLWCALRAPARYRGARGVQVVAGNYAGGKL